LLSVPSVHLSATQNVFNVLNTINTHAMKVHIKAVKNANERK